MAQTFAIAQLVGPDADPTSKEQKHDGTIVVPPTAPAQVLPPFGESPNALAVGEEAPVSTAAVATIAGRSSSLLQPSGNNNNGSTTTTTTYSVTPVSTATSSLPTHVQDRLVRMKNRRKAGQFMGTTAGTVAGLVVLGPFGAILGGFGAHLVIKGAGRARERRVRTKAAHQQREERGQQRTTMSSRSDRPIYHAYAA